MHTIALYSVPPKISPRKKLHWNSIAHLHIYPSPEKLQKLINNLGKECSENADLKREAKRITNNYEICKRYKKAPPLPVVSLSMASRFQETVTMDLNYYQEHTVLHLIDMCTHRYHP